MLQYKLHISCKSMKSLSVMLGSTSVMLDRVGAHLYTLWSLLENIMHCDMKPDSEFADIGLGFVYDYIAASAKCHNIQDEILNNQIKSLSKTDV